jgi:hypothetical protein
VANWSVHKKPCKAKKEADAAEKAARVRVVGTG